MSRTKRIYNNPRLKAPRYNLDDDIPQIAHGIPYTVRSWVCMGHCRHCRDPNKDRRVIRKRNKEQFRLESKLASENLIEDII